VTRTALIQQRPEGCFRNVADGYGDRIGRSEGAAALKSIAVVEGCKERDRPAADEVVVDSQQPGVVVRDSCQGSGAREECRTT
jgi:hypothetical protein